MYSKIQQSNMSNVNVSFFVLFHLFFFHQFKLFELVVSYFKFVGSTLALVANEPGARDTLYCLITTMSPKEVIYKIAALICCSFLLHFLMALSCFHGSSFKFMTTECAIVKLLRHCLNHKYHWLRLAASSFITTKMASIFYLAYLSCRWVGMQSPVYLQFSEEWDWLVEQKIASLAHGCPSLKHTYQFGRQLQFEGTHVLYICLY